MSSVSELLARADAEMLRANEGRQKSHSLRTAVVAQESEAQANVVQALRESTHSVSHYISQMQEDEMMLSESVCVVQVANREETRPSHFVHILRQPHRN